MLSMNNDSKPPLDHRKHAFTIPEAAAVASVGESTLRAAIKRGDLPQRYPSTRPVILASDLDNWLQSLPSDPPTRRSPAQSPKAAAASATLHESRGVTLQQIEAQAAALGVTPESLLMRK
jgi:hypothetical protein